MHKIFPNCSTKNAHNNGFLKNIAVIVFFLLTINASANTTTDDTLAIKNKHGNITTLVLHGTYKEMGFQYGQAMKDALNQTLTILKDYYINKEHMSYEDLCKQGENFYNKFPKRYQLFIQEEAKGSGLKLSDVQILNAMETIVPGRGSCSFISLPPKKTLTGKALIGRNYDFPEPFNQIAKYLTVTVLSENIPTAIIALPGQIYCPTCINAHNLFMELNNGMPSGGFKVEEKEKTMLITLLKTMQNSYDLFHIEQHLSEIDADYSLIINTATDKGEVVSYEFSSNSILGMKDKEYKNDVFVSTNFFLDERWKGLPEPTDDTTWQGVTRRKNLLATAAIKETFDINSFQKLMDLDINHGGAVWDLTIYQIIFDPSNQSLYIKTNNESSNWNKIPLGELFSLSKFDCKNITENMLEQYYSGITPFPAFFDKCD